MTSDNIASKPASLDDMNALLGLVNQVKAEIPYLEKDGKNTHFRYAYVSAEAVKAAVSRASAKVGLAWSTHLAILEKDAVGNQTRYTIMCTLTFLHGTASLVVVGLGQGQDPGDKGIMKAQTAALREALKNAFCIPGGDFDPESDEETDKTAKTAPTGKAIFDPSKPNKRVSRGEEADTKIDEVIKGIQAVFGTEHKGGTVEEFMSAAAFKKLSQSDKRVTLYDMWTTLDEASFQGFVDHLGISGHYAKIVETMKALDKDAGHES